MGAPVRIQLSRKAGWRMPEGAVKVDRTTEWGNPFRVEALEGGGFAIVFMWHHMRTEPHGWFETKAEALAEAVTMHRDWLLGEAGQFIRNRIRTELRGLDLACWCGLDAPCHADTTMEVANGAEG